jgi:hypothetical protein
VDRLNRNVPPEFAALVHGMMAKNPDQRPASMAHVRAELARWGTAESITPMDQEADPTFQAAIAALQTGPVPADEEAWAFTRPERLGRPREPGELHDDADMRFKLLVVAVAMIWGLVVLLLIVLFVLV